jgi:TatD DNase family protein
MIVDTHTHLGVSEFNTDRKEVVKRANDVGVSKIITVGVDLESSKKAVELSQKYPEVYAAIGIQPEEANKYIDDRLELKSDFRQCLERLAGNKKIVAVGEIGLDYKWARKMAADKDGPIGTEILKQKEIFRRQLGLAVELDLPAVVHCREAEEDILTEIERYRPTKKLRGVIHCFTGTEPFARKVMECGFYISFSGIITFPNAKHLKEIVRNVPLDRILAETDSPFIAPRTYRGKRNEPAYIVEIVSEIAETLGLNVNKVSQATSQNAKKLFRLD